MSLLRTPLTARQRLVVLAWAAACMVLAGAHNGWHSWHFFSVAGSDLLETGRHDGLHIYAAHPELQFGPVTVATAAAVMLLPAGKLIAAGLMAVLGVVVVRCFVDVAEGRLDRRALLAMSVVLAPLWAVVAVQYAHLDDTLAITFMALAMTRIRREQWWWATVLLALAVGAKPWVLPMVVLVLAAPRRRWPALAALGAGLVALPWLPFFLADQGTGRISSFRIPIDAGSGLHALGVNAGGTPVWDRPVQFAAAALLSIVALRRGRWTAVPFVVLAIRIAIDPGAYEYYAAGLAAAAGFVDAGRAARRPAGADGRRLPAYTLGVGAWVAVDLLLQALGLGLLRSAVRLVVPPITAVGAVLGGRKP